MVKSPPPARTVVYVWHITRGPHTLDAIGNSSLHRGRLQHTAVAQTGYAQLAADANNCNYRQLAVC